jgi:hypothetical protein
MRIKTLSVRGLISLLSASALAATMVVGTMPGVALAAAPPAPYFNGFETNTAGWNDYSTATITRVASGDTSTTYASGIAASPDGVAATPDGYYARLGKATTNTTCVNGGGTQDWFVGPYTDFDGLSSTFPTGGYSTGVDVYLDVSYATGHLDNRFDWSSEISDTSGNPRRDFVFNVGTDATGFVINGSTNANRCGAEPYTSGIHVTQSGWYTFKHTFTNVSGVLSASLQLINKSDNSTVHSWVLSDPSDTIGATGTVGGNGYGWFVQNEFDGLAIDNSYRTGVAPKCTATGFIRDGIDLTAAQIGGAVTGTLDATTCNIGAYNPTSVTGATIFGANYFGILANHVALNVTNSTIRNIGETPLNGSQHGNAVVYINGASGTISGNTVSTYQKNGITVSGKAADGVSAGPKTSASVLNNVVTGQGPITYIAQNGIQISYGATATVKGNTVSGNNYTPTTYVACGLLLYQAGGVNASSNILFSNERNQCNFGKGGGQFNP